MKKSKLIYKLITLSSLFFSLNNSFSMDRDEIQSPDFCEYTKNSMEDSKKKSSYTNLRMMLLRNIKLRVALNRLGFNIPLYPRPRLTYHTESPNDPDLIFDNYKPDNNKFNIICPGYDHSKFAPESNENLNPELMFPMVEMAGNSSNKRLKWYPIGDGWWQK